MKVVVTVERRFERTGDGLVWTPSTEAYAFWQRYLGVFDQVQVIGRVRDVGHVDPTWQQADGPGVSFAAIPHFVGPFQYLRQHRRVKCVVRTALSPDDAVILRAPGTLATALEASLRGTQRPYAVEVVADPHEVFAPGSVGHPLRPFFRWWYRRNLRRQSAHACAVAYVTAASLQRRYPASQDAYVTSYSTIDLPEEAFVTEPRSVPRAGDPYAVLLIGSLEQLYKGPDVLLKAVSSNIRNGLDIRLTIVGDGKHRPELEALARACGLSEQVRFTGNLPAGRPIRAELDKADLFVLPSRSEGLPRALVEAMARGLPCLGSCVGGIPELLAPEELVPPGDADMLAAKIAEVLGDGERQVRLSARNLEVARKYHANNLRPRRRAFYLSLREATTQWQCRDSHQEVVSQ